MTARFTHASRLRSWRLYRLVGLQSPHVPRRNFMDVSEGKEGVGRTYETARKRGSSSLAPERPEQPFQRTVSNDSAHSLISLGFSLPLLPASYPKVELGGISGPDLIHQFFGERTFCHRHK